MSDTDSVVNCPTCKRVIWRNTTCHHGRVPPPDTDPARARESAGNTGPVPDLDDPRPGRLVSV